MHTEGLTKGLPEAFNGLAAATHHQCPAPLLRTPAMCPVAHQEDDFGWDTDDRPLGATGAESDDCIIYTSTLQQVTN